MKTRFGGRSAAVVLSAANSNAAHRRGNAARKQRVRFMGKGLSFDQAPAQGAGRESYLHVERRLVVGQRLDALDFLEPAALRVADLHRVAAGGEHLWLKA